MTLQEALKKHEPPKYRNRKITTDEGTFDSMKEFHRWQQLKLLQRAGEIKLLRRQVKYTLIPPQEVDGRVVERPVEYIADFVYHDKNGNFVVEDAKSPATRTPVYVIKRKLMLYKHGIHIKEV